MKRTNFQFIVHLKTFTAPVQAYNRSRLVSNTELIKTGRMFFSGDHIMSQIQLYCKCYTITHKKTVENKKKS